MPIGFVRLPYSFLPVLPGFCLQSLELASLTRLFAAIIDWTPGPRNGPEMVTGCPCGDVVVVTGGVRKRNYQH
jgi:hypothetical protein